MYVSKDYEMVLLWTKLNEELILRGGGRVWEGGAQKSGQENILVITHRFSPCVYPLNTNLRTRINLNLI